MELNVKDMIEMGLMGFGIVAMYVGIILANKGNDEMKERLGYSEGCPDYSNQCLNQCQEREV